MLEERGNLWEFYPTADALCVTTNGDVLADDTCVMGRGIAKEVKERFPGIDKYLGERIEDHGNHVHDLGFWEEDVETDIISFPVKHHWGERADIELIYRSACELVNHINCDVGGIGRDENGHNMVLGRIRNVLLPRPGCGNGGLNWEVDVKPVIEPILDDRFVVVTF